MGGSMVLDRSAAFFHVLEKSELLTAEQLAYARDAAEENDDPKALAWNLVHREWLSRWQAGQMLLAGRTCFFWGRYKLIDVLGQGGMGKVYLARHTMMNRPVALKTISRKLEKDPAAMQRFLIEARAVAALDHPNIVHAYSVDNEGDTYYMVLEYVEGQNLQQLVEAEGPLDYLCAADYVRQAADGLAHAHSKGLIHCDIKPSNLLVNAQGVVKILDMGMARVIGQGEPAEEETNGAAGLVGTVDFMAPEQATQSPDFDHRADLYSLGCTLYYLLTGHPPFPEGTVPERIVKHQSQEPRSILDERPTAPRDLVRICREMMAKNPAERFQSAEEVSRRLADWRPLPQKILKAVPLDESGRDEAEKTPNVAVWPLVLGACRRRVALASAGAVLALLVVSGLILLGVHRSRTRDRTEELRRPRWKRRMGGHSRRRIPTQRNGGASCWPLTPSPRHRQNQSLRRRRRRRPRRAGEDGCRETGEPRGPRREYAQAGTT